MVSRDEMLWCWGDGVLVPYMVIGPAGVREVTLGSTHACLRNKEGEVICWGENGGGQLGNGSDEEWYQPNLVSLEDARSVQSYGESSCAIKTDNSVWCWGPGGGSSGDGSLYKELRPRKVHAPERVRNVSVFARHACVRTWGDSIWCWGEDRYGHIGRPAFIRDPKVTLF